MTTLFDLRVEKSQDTITLIQTHLEATINIIQVDDQQLKACTGCWDCWLKTPGLCAINDEMQQHYQAFMRSDTVMLLIDTAQGFIHHGAKAFIDRLIALHHPYIVFKHGECRHKTRYKTYPKLLVHVDNSDLTALEKDMTRTYLSRMADHYRSKAYLMALTPSFNLEPLKRSQPIHKTIKASKTPSDEPWIIYTGSPRRKKSNTQVIVDALSEDVKANVEIRDLKNTKHFNTWQSTFKDEPNVLFVLPLYVHHVPSHVLRFIKGLKPSQGNLAFFVQSGFPESAQSHYVEGYFEGLSQRLNRTYKGTAIKGGCEALQHVQASTQANMLKPITDTLEHLIIEGFYLDQHLNKLKTPVKFSGLVRVLVSFMFKLGIINRFWNTLLKENGAYALRHARPYLEKKR